MNTRIRLVRAARRGAPSHRSRARAGLSQQADHLRRAVHAGRLHRRHRPRHRARLDDGAGPAGRRRQQARRGRRASARAYVAKAKPDGYTLFGGTISTHAINASLYKNLPYDPVKDFEPVTLVGFLPERADRRSEPRREHGAGADRAAEGGSEQAHLRVVRRGHVDAPRGRALRRHHRRASSTHIPYKGTPQAMQDVVGGQVHVHVRPDHRRRCRSCKAGKLRLLAVTTAQAHRRWRRTLPTMAEAGVKDFEMVVVAGGVRAEGHAEADRRQRLNGEIVEDPEDARRAATSCTTSWAWRSSAARREELPR